MTTQQKCIENIAYIYFYLEGRHIDGLNDRDTVSILPTFPDTIELENIREDMYGEFKRSDLTIDKYIKGLVNGYEKFEGVNCNDVWELIDLIRPEYIKRAGRKNQ